MSDAQVLAREFLDAWDHGKLIGSVRARHPDFDWPAAYDVAAEIVALRRARGERCAGRKIGFTNRNIWPEYGATAPIWGHVYDTSLVYARDGKAVVSLRNSIAPKLEPEIAFRLRSSVREHCREPAEILQSIEWLAPAFEIVDCHFADWKFTPAESAADFSFHWRLVVGTPVPLDRYDLGKLAQELRDCEVALKRNGEVRERGVGANALDHPALALAFLADLLATQPRFDALAAGEVVTTGTLTAALPIKAGETWTSEISGLGVAPLMVEFTK
jgi:2-oxo-3-hexenedioate decarboxylase